MLFLPFLPSSSNSYNPNPSPNPKPTTPAKTPPRLTPTTPAPDFVTTAGAELDAFALELEALALELTEVVTGCVVLLFAALDEEASMVADEE